MHYFPDVNLIPQTRKYIAEPLQNVENNKHTTYSIICPACLLFEKNEYKLRTNRLAVTVTILNKN